MIVGGLRQYSFAENGLESHISQSGCIETE